MVGEILYALMLVLGVPALLALAVGWIRRFVELLWLLPLRPVIIATTVLALLGIANVFLGIIFRLPSMRPLSFSLAVVAVPFAAVPLSNYIAYRRRGGIDRELAWKDFIFEATRQEQRRNYEAPRSEQ